MGSGKLGNSVSTLPADNWNAQNNERQNIVESADITLDPEVGPDTDLNMLSKAVAGYANAANTYQDSGGVNSYVLSLTTNLKPPAKYFDNMTVRFKVGNTNTGASTINVNSLGAKDIKNIFGGDIPAGTLVTGRFAVVTYNTGTDVFVISDGAAAVAHIQPIRDVARNLIVKNNAGNPTFQVDIDADEIVLKGIDAFIAQNVNLTADITVSGANGLDTGVEANDEYHLWVIYNPTTDTVASLISLSPTAPTMPSGYARKARVSAIFNVAGDFISITQRGRSCVTEARQIINGLNPTSYTLIDLTDIVPVTARAVDIYWGSDTVSSSTAAAFASNSSGLGVRPASNVNSGLLLEGVYGPVNIHNILIETAQSIYFKLASAAVTIDAYVVAWEFE